MSERSGNPSIGPIIGPSITDLFSLKGRVAILTGATGHLGNSMAFALAEAGASVVATSRRLPDAQAVAHRLPLINSSQKHHAIELDQMDEGSLHTGFDAAVAAAGQIDILINNGHELSGADWASVTAEQFNRQLANATAYFQLSRLVRDHAVSRGARASIVMLASMYGLVGSYPDSYADLSAASPVAYHTLKGGILQMTRHLAVYWAKDGVRVNALSPGPFPSDKANRQVVERLKTKSPMARMGQPHELKGAVVFLASDASSYMTGQNLVIDGGWTAW